jgi:iron-sulfur cluster insertion protein
MSSPLIITDAAKTRIQAQNAYLQIVVEGGGCSGFQYVMTWVPAPVADSVIIDGGVVTDSVSLPYLTGATLDFNKTLMGEDFSIKNPNASSSCGCGTSFSVE